MKWLLITNTQNRNPGDEWIRMGVERLISDVDASPQFIIRNKEFVEDQKAECEFDRAVWCGSPLFWSHQYQNCWDNHWWNDWINGWLYRDKRKVLVLGVGSVLGSDVAEPEGYFDAIRLVQSKCWMLVTRQKLLDDPAIPVSCCPSIFALAGEKVPKDLFVCNLMPDGAHDPFLDLKQSSKWRDIVQTVSDQLRSLGAQLVCHAILENDFADRLGWPKDRIHYKFDTPEPYLSIYARARHYVGNRMHGAVMTQGGGGSALVIGYDSRLDMVTYTGGTAMRPTEMLPETIERWMGANYRPYDWEPEYAKQLHIMRRFASD